MKPLGAKLGGANLHTHKIMITDDYELEMSLSYHYHLIENESE